MEQAYRSLVPLLDRRQRLSLAIALQQQAVERAFRERQTAHVHKDAAPAKD